MIYRIIITMTVVGSLLGQTLPIPAADAAQGGDLAVLSRLPAPGTRLRPSKAFAPVTLRGLRVDPSSPWRLEFLIDAGDDSFDLDQLPQTNQRLVNYFLSALTVPDEQLWVNLSPQESNRIIPQRLARTELGRDMLAQDYILKQMTASLLYPEEGTGAEFWERIHRRAQQEFGTTDIPTNTFNKVWVVPRTASVHVAGNTVLIIDSQLDVMLEEDYLSLPAHTAETPQADAQPWSEQAKELVREVILPEISREVNFGRHFAQLRQIYHAMLLATWYKRNVGQNLLGTVYVDHNLITGIDHAEPQVKDEIYQKYIKAFEQGAFDYIREDVNPYDGFTVPRRYFSGGLRGYDQTVLSAPKISPDTLARLARRPLLTQPVTLYPITTGSGHATHENQMPISQLPNPDTELFKRLEIAQFQYNAYGEISDNITFIGEGFSRRAYALEKEYPHLVFKIARSDTHAEPPDPTEAQILSALAHHIGYQTIIIDGLELLNVPGIAPFRYHGDTLIQLRGTPTQDITHFHQLVALFRDLGIPWELSDTPRPSTQLQNIALFEEEGKLIPRVTDLKDFESLTDKALTAEDHQQLSTLFTEYYEESTLYWTALKRLSKEIMVEMLLPDQTTRQATLLDLLTDISRTVDNMRELPIFKRAEAQLNITGIMEEPNKVFYFTIHEMLLSIDSLAKTLTEALQKHRSAAIPLFGPTTQHKLAQQLKDKITDLHRMQAKYLPIDWYPVLRRLTEERALYTLYTDLIWRDVNMPVLRQALETRRTWLGLNEDVPSVITRKTPGLLTIKKRLQALHDQIQAEKSPSFTEDPTGQYADDIEDLVQMIIAIITKNEHTTARVVSGSADELIQSLVIHTSSEILHDALGFLITSDFSSIPRNTAQGKLAYLIEAIDWIQQRFQSLTSTSKYTFEQDPQTQRVLIRKNLDLHRIPLPEISLPDRAILNKQTKGGIDMNPANLDIKQSGDGLFNAGPRIPNVHSGEIKGVRPVLLTPAPITNLPLLLGLSSETEKESITPAVILKTKENTFSQPTHPEQLSGKSRRLQRRPAGRQPG